MLRCKQKKSSNPDSQSGFTIIESLVALLVVAILLTAVAPVIVLATATRLQARRVELATQAAKTYIDGVEAGALPPPSIKVQLNPTAVSSTPDGYLFNSIAGNSVAVPSNITGLHCVDKKGMSTTCDANTSMFAIQSFRTTASTVEDADKGYRMGLRVYRADAFKDGGATAGPKQMTFTGGLGDRKAPLVEMLTEISTASTTYDELCKRLGGCS